MCVCECVCVSECVCVQDREEGNMCLCACVNIVPCDSIPSILIRTQFVCFLSLAVRNLLKFSSNRLDSG